MPRASTTSPGKRLVASARRVPLTLTRMRPAPAAPSTCAPSLSERNTARITTSEPGWCTTAGRPSHHVATLLAMGASYTTSPAGSRISRRAPGFPVTGSRSVPSRGLGTVALVRQPWCTLTVVVSPRPRRSDWARLTRADGGRHPDALAAALCRAARWRLGSISATLRTLALRPAVDFARCPAGRKVRGVTRAAGAGRRVCDAALAVSRGQPGFR